MLVKDLLSIDQLTRVEFCALIERALELKQGRRRGSGLLDGRTVALLFQKPSLRTRVSFEMAALQLGGRSLYLSPAEVGLGERESVADVARVLSRYVDAVVARTFFHEDVERLAECATIPIINGLSDRSHPCQALADVLTMYERFGATAGIKVAYLGDGNNVARSLIEAAPLAEYELSVASPKGYEPDPACVAEARAAGARIEVGNDPAAAVSGAHVVYTDAWFSMGQEAEREARAKVFPPFQVSSSLIAAASEQVIVMHCLPAHRGEEISEEVIDGPHSAVFDQAENRLHAQKALLATLLDRASE